MTDPINTQFINRSIFHRIGLEKYKKWQIKRILSLLNSFDEKTRDALILGLAKIEKRGSASNVQTQIRIQSLIKQYEKIRDEAFKKVQDQLEEDLIDLGDNERNFQIFMILGVLSVLDTTIIVNKVSLSVIKDDILNKTFYGDTLNGWIQNTKASDVDRVKRTIKFGISQGHSDDQILKAVIGTEKAKYSDGIMDTARRNIQSIVRTSVTHAATQSASAIYASNTRLIDSEVFVAVLDSRTTETCRALNGKIYKTGEGPMPPIHFGCRSQRIPIILGGKIYTGKKMFGPVYGKFTYQEWLSKQSDAVQNEILGVYKAQQYRRGTLREKDLFDGSGQAYNIDEVMFKDKWYAKNYDTFN